MEKPWVHLLLMAWCLLFVSRLVVVVEAVLVGGVLLPHGDFALDPTFFATGTAERTAAERIAVGARRAGRWLLQKQHDREEEPLIVLLTTPHGIQLDFDYGIFVASRGSGTALVGGDCIGDIGRAPNRPTSSNSSGCQCQPYNVSLDNIPLAPTILAEDLLCHLNPTHPVSGIYSPSEDVPIPLHWGEIVPLLLLPQTNGVLPLILTFPRRRYDHAVEMVPELLDIGSDILEWVQRRPERIAVVVSGDLSHTHLSDGPYGYSNASAPYDDAIGTWAGDDPCHTNATAALLERAKELQPKAKSCGFTGYVLWHGMMCSRSVWLETRNANNADRDMAFHSNVFANQNVTYYGMIAAVFEPYTVRGQQQDGNHHVQDDDSRFISGDDEDSEEPKSTMW